MKVIVILKGDNYYKILKLKETDSTCKLKFDCNSIRHQGVRDYVR